MNNPELIPQMPEAGNATIQTANTKDMATTTKPKLPNLRDQTGSSVLDVAGKHGDRLDSTLKSKPKNQLVSTYCKTKSMNVHHQL